ncbi:hypothetical protein MSAS_01970 [Mycobacterium saskatchewanense]|nr:hypothetical protein MSAS_01970 [Mycobacterium saskatchewanense]
MGANSREDVVEVFDALDDDVNRLCELSFDVLTTPERLRALERLERVARRLRAPQHALINQPGAQASAEEQGGSWRSGLADRLRITKAEAGRRIEEAQDLGERRALTGEPLAPRLSATAAGQREGLVGDGHVPGRPPKPIWPARPPDTDPTSWPSTPGGSWIGCTPTANSATPSGSANAE